MPTEYGKAKRRRPTLYLGTKSTAFRLASIASSERALSSFCCVVLFCDCPEQMEVAALATLQAVCRGADGAPVLLLTP